MPQLTLCAVARRWRVAGASLARRWRVAGVGLVRTASLRLGIAQLGLDLANVLLLLREASGGGAHLHLLRLHLMGQPVDSQLELRDRLHLLRIRGAVVLLVRTELDLQLVLRVSDALRLTVTRGHS